MGFNQLNRFGGNGLVLINCLSGVRGRAATILIVSSVRESCQIGILLKFLLVIASGSGTKDPSNPANPERAHRLNSSAGYGRGDEQAIPIRTLRKLKRHSAQAKGLSYKSRLTLRVGE
jgi:hypothetical protein